MYRSGPIMGAIADRVNETVQAIRARSALAPRVGVVLGSGLGAFADSMDELVKIPYADLPHLPASKVVGHAGNMCLGRVRGVPTICMQGRVHFYEGHSLEACVQGVRAMARLGVTTVLLTNAAGGVEPTWAAGDLMVIEDHLNLTAQTPLMGPNDPELGPRFPDMSRAYDPELRAMLVEVAKGAGVPLRAGVYAWLTGPSYETPAEVRMVRGLGAHAVGMSTVPEVVALRHMGVRVGALSCITNLAAGLVAGQVLSHAEVEETARLKRDALLALLTGWVARAGAT